MGHRTISNFLLFFIPVLLVVGAAAGLVWVYYQGRSPHTRVPSERAPYSYNRNPALQQEMRGLSFDGFQEGRKILTIKAARLSIEKKKVGIFRFGLLQEAHLEDAFICIYMEEDVPAKGTAISTQSQVKTKQIQPVNLEKVLSKEALPPIKGKRISSIVINPVQFALYKGEEVLSRISAAKASIRFSKHDIVFEGNVSVEAGSRSLHTNRLSLLTKRGEVTTDLPYVLTSAGDKVRGNGLVTDIFLSSF